MRLHQKLLNVALAPIFVTAALSAHAESRGYIISSFGVATNEADFKANCPENRNGGRIDWYIRDLVGAGYTHEQAVKIIANASDSVQLGPEIMRRMEGRAIVNGKHVSIYNYPDAVPDPNIETVVGKYAYGFDLGSPNRTSKFIDPDTHRPVDNQLWRAVGCLETFKGDYDYAPGWVLQISGDDLSKDGKVTVTLNQTTQDLMRDARGQVTEKASYVVDGPPSSENVFAGEIKNGVLSIEPGTLHLEGSRYRPFVLQNAHMRLQSHGADLVGYWGGFMQWRAFTYAYTSSPAGGADTLGLYHAVKKMADADPDPKTGQNREISGTFRIEAVPAYLLDAQGKVLARPANAPLGGPVD
jgi:hypothetical protein